MRFIRFLLAFLFLFVVIIADIYVYRESQSCVQPITYRIGAIDPRFHVSQEQVTEVARRATSVWNTALGEEKFLYDVGGELPISLVYDDRQATADNHAVLETFIDAQKKLLADSSATIQSLQQEFSVNKAAYEKDVAYWNSRGGATPEAYAQLEKQRTILNGYVARLNSLSKSGTSQTAQVNQQIATYNALASKKFEGGVFESSSKGKKTITIYEFESMPDFEYVLAHELGHALGLEHVADTHSVMSAEHVGANIADVKLTTDDMAELHRVCGMQKDTQLDMIFARIHSLIQYP